MSVRITDDLVDIALIARTLVEHVAELPDGIGLVNSLDRMIGDGTYRLLVADDDRTGRIDAAGIVTIYWQPMIEKPLLAVEALWSRYDSLNALLPVWSLLTDFARRLDFDAIVMAPGGTNARMALDALTRQGNLDEYPVTTGVLPLQKRENPSAVWSSFARKHITHVAFESVPVAIVHMRTVVLDVSGREYTGEGPLYRGEGRLKNDPHWMCSDLEELAEAHFANGFFAKRREIPVGSEAPFAGTISEQLMHQGAVGQGAVSLTTSFDIAASYATHAGKYDEGLVFTVDVQALRQSSKIFDAQRTLQEACPWISLDDWIPLRNVIMALKADLYAAGSFLERCDKEAFERAKAGYGSLVPMPDLNGFLSSDARACFTSAGGRDDDLVRTFHVFEEFAEFALKKIGMVDELHLDDQGGYMAESHRAAPMAYFEVFSRVHGHMFQGKELGWDTTPYGYIAKTLRDEECFSPGPVPGACISEAVVVGKTSAAGRLIQRHEHGIPYT